MKKFDLDSELKSARVPERDTDFWDAFPRRVMAQVHTAPAPPPARMPPQNRLAWGFAMALSCLAAGFCFWQTHIPQVLGYAFLENEREFRQTIQQLPCHARALMQDQHGLGKLVQDQP